MGKLYLRDPFAYPIHPGDWTRPPGSPDYRVTNPYDGEDLINGGIHAATDLGNADLNDPVYAVASCRARGLAHFDGALGVEYDLGDGVLVRFWHLNRVDLPSDWTDVTAGEQVGLTGQTGAPVNGEPMPAHTHAEAERDGVTFDIEPALLGEPLEIAGYEEGPDMEIPSYLSCLTAGTLPAGHYIRPDPATEGGRTYDEAVVVQVFGRVNRTDLPPWNVNGVEGYTWYYVGYANEAGFVATRLLKDAVYVTDLGTEVLYGIEQEGYSVSPNEQAPGRPESPGKSEQPHGTETAPGQAELPGEAEPRRDPDLQETVDDAPEDAPKSTGTVDPDPLGEAEDKSGGA